MAVNGTTQVVMNVQTSNVSRPLCVDVDGTLLRTDLLYESFCRLLATRPLQCLFAPVWLLKGKAHLKRMIASRVLLDPASLPWEPATVECIERAKAEGREVVLASASDSMLVAPLAEQLALSSEIIASDGTVSYSGIRKAEKLTVRFGSKEFDYIGNSHVDVPVWRAAGRAIAVVQPGTSPSFLRSGAVHEVLPARSSSPYAAFRLLRVHQWVKNLLVFLPLVMAHRFTELSLFLSAVLAFVSFSLVASSVYIVNDLIDLPSDRAHPRKSKRPLASGDVALRTGLLLAPLLLVAGSLVSLTLPPSFFAVLAGYFVLTCAYSFKLKQVPLLDILFLALLYGIRIIAGGVACSVPVSAWLLAFSLFFFFGLACVKRYSEILSIKRKGIEEVAGRGYRASDIEFISSLGTGSSLLSVLVLALYINGREVIHLYSHPEVLWLACPLLLYWVSRVWFLAHRAEMHDDPVVFALRDTQSYIIGAFVALSLWWAM